ncbi:MAG: protein-L-isoaspartate(D-aspartate) O-methyltransferase [Lysobacterales bacterium]|jgi:protein-L-isoaspartate(D-aspartate) O-methyltransferase
MRAGRLILAVLSLAIMPAIGLTAPDFTAQRKALVDEVRAYARHEPPPGRAGISERVLKAMGEVRRHEFVPPESRPEAYANHPLPIGHGQTISQPYIVALMTDLLNPEPGDVVLEVGTGSGYQAAVLAKLVNHVYSIEIIEPLVEQGAARLGRLGYGNVTTKLGDGYYGWKEHAPFDAIVVTAAASHVPPPLIEQLKPGGRMVIPVGGRFLVQYLLLVEKTEAGEIITRQITAVRFVPLTGEH